MLKVGSGTLLGVVVLAGCAADSKPGASVEAPATETVCVNLLKDMRQHCRQGIRDSRAPGGIDCLSARLEFERRCL